MDNTKKELIKFLNALSSLSDNERNENEKTFLRSTYGDKVADFILECADKKIDEIISNKVETEAQKLSKSSPLMALLTDINSNLEENLKRPAPNIKNPPIPQSPKSPASPVTRPNRAMTFDEMSESKARRDRSLPTPDSALF